MVIGKKVKQNLAEQYQCLFSRWFFDGCCECVGSTCINYGVNESRCRNCPESKEDDFDDEADEDMKDFGDNMGPFDGSVNSNY